MVIILLDIARLHIIEPYKLVLEELHKSSLFQDVLKVWFVIASNLKTLLSLKWSLAFDF